VHLLDLKLSEQLNAMMSSRALSRVTIISKVSKPVSASFIKEERPSWEPDGDSVGREITAE
jgi:hypothetical protein